MDDSETIYRMLLNRPTPATNREIASVLHLSSDRDIQGNAEDPGVLEKAREYIWQTYKKFLVTNFEGSIITPDIEAAKLWIEPLIARTIRAHGVIGNYQRRFKEAQEQQPQLQFNEG